MYPVNSNFHILSTQYTPKTRARIYFIDDTVDCTNDSDVQTNGTLLVGAAGDTDSNGRIGQGGVTINEIFNKDQNISIGGTVSYQIGLTVLNGDRSLDSFAFGRCKVYIDVWDDTAQDWLACPMGVYRIELPMKRKVQLISCSGYDQMQLLNVVADNWWNGLDWHGGLTMLQIVQSMAATLGLNLSANTATALVNSSVSFTASPFTSIEMTYRDILGIIAEATGTIARFDRDGSLDLRWFNAAQIAGETVEISADTVGTQCLSVDIAEYQAAQIDALQAKSTEADVGVTVGTGDNTLVIFDNPLLGGADSTEIEGKITPIYNRVNALGAYSPISIKVVADWSIEAGDIISFTYGGETFTLPIFQQTYTWRGGYVTAQMLSNGEATMPTTNGALRSEYRSKTRMHEFEVTLETLLSRIESINGDFTQIQQTVDAITQIVNGQGITISDILDKNGEIWTAIKTNEQNIGTVGDDLRDEITTRTSYIRFLPAEPAIVLGVESGNPIKLKLVNDKIYFFSGADDSTDLSNAYAYFNSEETGVDRLVASESVTVGSWIWKQLANGHYVLDFVG